MNTSIALSINPVTRCESMNAIKDNKSKQEFLAGFSARVRKRAADLGITQADVARATGASRATVSAWFSGANAPQGEYAVSLRRILRCSWDWLMEQRGHYTAASSDAAVEALQRSWECNAASVIGAAVVVPALDSDGNLDQADLTVLPTAFLGGPESWAPLALYTVSSDSAMSWVKKGEKALIDTSVSSFTQSGGYYVIASQAGLSIHKVVISPIGEAIIEDEMTSSSVSLPPEKLELITVIGRAVARFG